MPGACYNKPTGRLKPPLGGRMRGEMKKKQDEFFTEIYNETYNDLGKFVNRRTRNPGMTEDILQEVYLEAFRHLGDLKTHENPVGWIYKTAYNKIKKMNSIYDRHALYETSLEEGVDQEVWDYSELVDLAQVSGSSVAGSKMKLSRIVDKLKKICRIMLLFVRF